MDKAEVWTIDIETSPLIVMVWELGKQYVNREQVIKDWHIMSFTAKKWGSSELVYMETRDGNDKPLLTRLWEIFNEADVVITQNGKKFDEPKIMARMMLEGFKPYKPFEHHDTFEQNTNKEFTSHSLEYLSDKFCTKFKKLKHKMFSGLSLWKECLGIKIQFNPNPKAWAEMRKYNNHDVLATEELFEITKGWSKKTAPTLFYDTLERECKYCGEASLIARGKDRTRITVYHKMQCKSCGKWQRGTKIEKEAA